MTGNRVDTDMPLIGARRVRTARDEDSSALIEVIGSAFAEYPGCVLDLDEEPWLRAPATWYREHYAGDGALLVAVDDTDRPIACIAWRVLDGVFELKSLYVAAAGRRGGLGSGLCGLVEQAARGRGEASIELWTDTRFLDAHRLYNRLGFRRTPQTRILNDLSDTVEFHYVKELAADLG